MDDFHFPAHSSLTRRRFLAAGACAAGGLALYSGEIARHRYEVTHNEVRIDDLPEAFDGFRIAQLSDIHLDEFTEPYFLNAVVRRINRFAPDAVVLTGDFVTKEHLLRQFAIGAAWRCAEILDGLACRQRYAVLGNHDVLVGADAITEALKAHSIAVLRNAFLPIERNGGRIWMAGLSDPLEGLPDLEAAIPPIIRNLPHEPVVLLCHPPDYVDTLLLQPAGPSVALMLSGHTHGGQVRLPFVGALVLPQMGRRYVEGWYRLERMQLYVNRGIGSVGVPFRLNCPPEISLFTLRAA